MKILIVEDEPLVALMLEEYIEELGHIVVGKCDRVVDVYPMLEESAPDLLMVDIELKGEESGIDLGNQLNKLKVPFVYLSNLQDLNTFNKAASTNPLSNIPKPVDRIRLRNTLFELEEKLSQNKVESDPATFFFVEENKSKVRVNTCDIVCLKASRNYCEIHTIDKMYLLSKPMGSLMNVLDKVQFKQVHRSFIVNTDYILSLSGNTIYLKGYSDPIQIGEKYKEKIKPFFNVI